MTATISPNISFTGTVGPESPIFIAFTPEDGLDKLALLGVGLPETEGV